MKTFESHNKSEKRLNEFFLHFSHLDELEIKFDFIENEGVDLFYIYNEKKLFYFDKRSKYISVSYYEIWSYFEKDFDLDYDETQTLMKKFISKYFKINIDDYIVSSHYYE